MVQLVTDLMGFIYVSYTTTTNRLILIQFDPMCHLIWLQKIPIEHLVFYKIDLNPTQQLVLMWLDSSGCRHLSHFDRYGVLLKQKTTLLPFLVEEPAVDVIAVSDNEYYLTQQHLFCGTQWSTKIDLHPQQPHQFELIDEKTPELSYLNGTSELCQSRWSVSGEITTTTIYCPHLLHNPRQLSLIHEGEDVIRLLVMDDTRMVQYQSITKDHLVLETYQSQIQIDQLCYITQTLRDQYVVLNDQTKPPQITILRPRLIMSEDVMILMEDNTEHSVNTLMIGNRLHDDQSISYLSWMLDHTSDMCLVEKGCFGEIPNRNVLLSVDCRLCNVNHETDAPVVLSQLLDAGHSHLQRIKATTEAPFRMYMVHTSLSLNQTFVINGGLVIS
jgi:hypothetical protein